MNKNDNLSEWYHNILEKTDIVDSRYPIKGMPVYRGWGLFMIRKMQQILEEMLEDTNHESVLFPVLIPEDILGKETKHIAGFEGQVFWVTHAGENKLERRLSLRPTSETPIYEMFKLWIRSHNDLPLKVNQSCAVYRYETKHTRPLIRGREFLWNEGHSAHVDEKDARRNIEEIKRIYKKLINDYLCIPFIISTRPEWDRFPGAVDTFAFDTILPDGKVLQIATVHNLGQNFSRVFDIKFEDKKGEHKFVYQTSYGPSFGRLLAALISIHGDDIGLILPPRIAPIQVIIIPILFKESEGEEIINYARRVERKLKRDGIRVRLDNSDERPGAKFFFWEMKGVPLRLEIGPKDLNENKITVVRRDTKRREQIELNNFDINSYFEKITKNLRTTAEDKFRKQFLTADNLDELKTHTGKGIIRTGWCNDRKCAERIEEYANILSVNKKQRRCIICGSDGTEILIAKTY